MSNNSPFSDKEGSSSDSSSSDSSDRKEEKPHVQCPQFVLIDERNGEKKYSYFEADSFQGSSSSFEEGEQIKHTPKGPLSLRFICLLGFIFCLIFGLGMLLSSIVMTCLATLSLFQNPNLNQGMRNFWKFFINACVAGFGFALGMISPTLGLGLLAIYFSLATHLMGDDLLRRVIRRSFSHL